jgi:hypothetical protein
MGFCYEPRGAAAPHLDTVVTSRMSAKSFGVIVTNHLVPDSLLRMTVSTRGLFVGMFTMLERRSCVLLRLFVLSDIVMMGRLVVMMRSGVVVSSRLMVMLTRWMFR